MPLINCEAELSFSWIENCVLSGGENTDLIRAIKELKDIRAGDDQLSVDSYQQY